MNKGMVFFSITAGLAILLAAGVLPAQEIVSFQNGWLTFENTDSNLYYTVEFRPGLTGEEDWDGSYRGLQDLRSSESMISVPVGMFFRVRGSFSPQYTRTLSSDSDALQAGYYEPAALSSVDPDLKAENIRAGTTVFGIHGTYDPRRILRLGGDLSFGEVAAGHSATRTLTVHNDGSEKLSITGISYPPGFSGSWSGTVAVGGSQSVTVTFTPAFEQSYEGYITVHSEAFDGVNTRTCSGTGVSSLPEADRVIFLHGNLQFGTVPVGSSAVRTLTIINDGEESLNIAGISYPDGFSGNWSGVIPGWGEETVTVTFTPETEGAYAGNLTVNSNATIGSNTLPVSGAGSLGGDEEPPDPDDDD